MRELPAWVVLLAAGAAIVVITRRRPGHDGDGVAPPGVSPRVRALAQAIARAEGFFTPGTLPAQTNNPGDLKLTGYPTTPNGISIFSSVDEGWAKLHRQLTLIEQDASRVYSRTMTLAEMGARWAPSGDNNITGAWARNVASALGVPVTTTLGELLG